MIVTFLLLLAFVIPALFIPADSMTEVLSAGVMIASGVGLWRWGPAAWRGFRRGAVTVESIGVIGVVLLLAAIAGQRIYAVTYLNMGRPEAFQVLHISPFITYLTLVALALFILATRYEGERPTRVGKWAAAAIAFLAIMLSALGPKLAIYAGHAIEFVFGLGARLF